MRFDKNASKIVHRKSFINQTITLLLATMLLMVAGAKSWSGENDKARDSVQNKNLSLHDTVDEDDTALPGSEQAKVSTLLLDAVITPAISFDFYQHFYFLSQPVWNFIQSESRLEITFTAPIYAFTAFSRIFGRDIVTNAP